jgi:hypothetical protein
MWAKNRELRIGDRLAANSGAYFIRSAGHIPHCFGKCAEVIDGEGVKREFERPVCAKCSESIGNMGVTDEIEG